MRIAGTLAAIAAGAVISLAGVGTAYASTTPPGGYNPTPHPTQTQSYDNGHGQGNQCRYDNGHGQYGNNNDRGCQPKPPQQCDQFYFAGHVDQPGGYGNHDGNCCMQPFGYQHNDIFPWFPVTGCNQPGHGHASPPKFCRVNISDSNRGVLTTDNDVLVGEHLRLANNTYTITSKHGHNPTVITMSPNVPWNYRGEADIPFTCTIPVP